MAKAIDTAIYLSNSIYFYSQFDGEYNNNFFKTILLKCLLTIILVLIGLIFIKIDDNNKTIIKKYVYTDSISFSYLYKY